MTLADRIAVMKDGELQQLGTPKEIYNKPNNMFVAGFMGSPSMNFIRGKVDLNSNDQPVAKVKDGEGNEHAIRLPESLRPRDGQDVVIGLRPENITEQVDDDTHATKLPLKIEVLEPTGPDTIAMVKVNEQEVACRLSPEFDVNVGEVTELYFDLSKAVFFDANTEIRIEH